MRRFKPTGITYGFINNRDAFRPTCVMLQSDTMAVFPFVAAPFLHCTILTSRHAGASVWLLA